MILEDKTIESNDRVKTNAREIKSEAERISSIVQKLLDYSRQNNSKKNIGDLRLVTNCAVDLLRPLAKKRNIAIEVAMPDAPAGVNHDSNQMQQVLMNLIDNAIEASPDNEVVALSLTKHSDSDRWVLSVEDHGHGIDPKILDKVFEPFFTTKDVGSGTGLGLSIVFGIIEDHGGTVSLSSTPDRGSTFFVELPARPMSPSAC